MAEPEQGKQVRRVIEERLHQDARWGEQNHDSATWLVILTEEVGEAAKATLALPIDRPPDPLDPPIANLETEITHVAAVALAWLECLARHRRTLP